jgi:hypothetical protein
MKCNAGYDWCGGLDVVHSDDERHYCAFHAPKDKKPVDFEALVFQRLNDALRKNELCDMSGAVFPDGFYFSRVNKDKKLPSLNFNKAVFGDGASFGGAKFGDRAYFGEAVFGNEAYFKFATFGDEAFFEGAKFGNGASFGGAVFGDRADFLGAKFGDRADFFHANFGNGAIFSGANFGNEAYFGEAVFGDGAFFFDANFGDNTIFSETIFKGSVKLGITCIKAVFHKAVFGGEAALDRLTAEKEIIFKDIDTRNLLFEGAMWRKMRFETCTWNETKEGRIVIQDEVLLNKKAENPKENTEESIGHVQDIYRALKLNFKNDHDEYMASFFHASEKEMLTKRTKIDKPFYWFVLHAYRFSSGYGENPRKALNALLLLLLLAFVFFGSVGLTEKENIPITLFKNVENVYYPDWENIKKISLTTFEYLTFQRDIYYKLSPASSLGAFAKILFQILVSIQATLFVFALRNRLRR